MDSDTRILCFRHCCSKSIFCKNILDVCPLCKLLIVNFEVEPFVIPYPYANAMHEPNAVVVRPSRGDFLTNYDIAHDLHIGISNSQGIVFEYDKEGLIINDCSRWTSCIAISIIPSSWDNHWNETLKAMLKDSKWRSENYNELSMNCYNFVIEFMNKLKYMDMDFVDKETMCDKLILPRIRDAVRYNSLFIKLKAHEFFIS
ncbi:MKRN2 opposite strand protein [Ceratina calcarata]|uniref:MKRN2 opposite strand protein n=1 Tax=Ceratina calcarata TaxID=156304 RepID=A0AAJ7S2Y5_9HYME|nr:MKRN2 opposite strand protein [Ceratina calcarata]